MKTSVYFIIFLVFAAMGWLYYDQAADTESNNAEPRRMSSRQRMPEVVTVETVEYREITDSIESIGTAMANESVSIFSKVTDTVNQVHFNDGDYVKKGQILVEMTNDEESALLAESQANLDEARRQLKRQMDLGEKGLAAKSAMDEAIAREEAAEARFNALTARMDDRLIRAPFSGILGFREISPGTLLTSNTQITTLDDIATIKLDFSVPELFLGTIKPGFRIIARSDVWRESEFEGVINSIGSRIDPETRAVTVRASIPNEEEKLKPGMLMTVQIITNNHQALVIPESAFIQTGTESFVFIAGEDGLAHRKVIEIGTRKFGYVEVINGLQQGDRIITEGGFKLQDKSPYRKDEQTRIDLSFLIPDIRPLTA
jgi:membrane fusion protein (multidrug efflux system)